MKPVSHNRKSKPKKSLIERLLTRFAPNLMLHRKKEQLPLLIYWRRIFILPTKPGLFFGFIALLMLIASLNFNNNMGLMMTFLLMGLAQVALYRVFFNLRNLTIHSISAKPVFLGETAIYTISLNSKENKYDICISNEHFQQQLLELPAEELTTIHAQKNTTRRGWQALGKIKVHTSYPFGLFFAWIWTNLDGKCLVYPTPESNPPPLPFHAQSEGNTQVITSGEEFHGLKPYQSGDSMRLIAWKRTAQTGELISRELQQNQGEKLLLDYSQMPLNDSEHKLSRLTAWVLIAQQQQVDYRLKLPQFDSDFGYSDAHLLSCLKALALFE